MAFHSNYFSAKNIKSIFFSATTKDLGIILISTTIVNLANFFYQIIMGRMLGPSEYGVLTTIISLLYISGAITVTFQTSTTRYISSFNAAGNNEKIKKFFIMMTIRFLILASIIFIVIILFLNPLTRFLKMNSFLPLIVLGILIITGSVASVVGGVIQGMERFKTFGFYSIISTGLKLILGVLLVYLGLKSFGAVVGLIVAGLVSYLVVLIFLRDILSLKSRSDSYEINIDLKAFYRSTVLILFSTILLTLISYIDVVLVKHFFSSEQTGYFSAASQIGKIILFFPGAIGIVIFPKLSRKFEKGENIRSIFVKSFSLLFVSSVFFLLVYYYFPGIITKIMYGKSFTQETSKLIFLYGLFMSIIGFINLQIFYFISTKRFWYLLYLFIFIIVEIVMIFIFHNTLQIILWVEIIFSFTVFTINILMMFLMSKRVPILKK